MTAAIVNPRSAGGKTGRRWPAIHRLLEARLGPIDVRFTERSGHASEIASQLLQDGCDRIVAAGGDGTFNEAANGFLHDDQPIRPSACLGLLPLGTGGDLRRTLGIPSAVEEAIAVLASGKPRPIDLGKAAYRNHHGAAETRYFINVVSFGMGGDVAARARNAFSLLGGKAAFLYATAEVFFRYRPRTIRLALDGNPLPHPYCILNIAIGNGRYHGGGMHVCPKASLDDGLLEVTVIEHLNMFTLAKDLPVLYSENLYVHPKTHHYRGRHIQAEAEQTTRIEVDGEALGALPLEVTILPKRLRVIAP